MPKEHLIYLSIPKPCHENWYGMTPNERGMHCGVCNREVIDFTGYSDTDLYRFFTNYQGSTCGRLLSDQVGRSIYVPPQPKSRLYGLLIACSLSLVFTQIPEAHSRVKNTPEILQESLANANTADENDEEKEKTSLKGTVRDKNSNLLDGATIELLKGKTIIATTISDSSGSFAIIGIPSGKYTVVAKLGGFETIKITNFYIPARKEQQLSLHFEPYVLGEIIYLPKHPIIDPENPSKSRISGDDIKNIPH